MECGDCGRDGEHAHWCMTEAFRKAQEVAWDEGFWAMSLDDNPYRAK